MSIEHIYETVVQHGLPSTLPGPWQRFKPHNSFFRIPANTEELFRELRGTFPSEDLLAAGVAVKSPQDLTILNPRLTKDGVLFLPLRKNHSEPPVDLLHDEGTLRGIWPIVAIFNDHHGKKLIQNGHRLCVVPSIVEMQILWTMGIAAIVPTGLGIFAREHITSFCQAFGLKRQRWIRGGAGQWESPNSMRPTLVLTDWSVTDAASKQFPHNDQIQRHLEDLQTHLGIDCGDFEIWQPKSGDLETLQFCLQSGEKADVVNSLIESLDTHISSFRSHRSAPSFVNAPVTYAESRQRWSALRHDGTDRIPGHQVLDELVAAHERELIDPLLAQPDWVADPRARHVVLALAETRRLQLPLTLRMAARSTRALRRFDFQGELPWSVEEFEQHQSLTDLTLRLIKELPPCPRRRK